MTEKPLDRPVVTRFAPSPTGHLHVGGARTALFNWAFARHHGGTFVLRIEDTDRARSTADSTRRIIEDLRWLDLDWDEGPRTGPSSDEEADHWDPQSGQADPRGVGPFFQSQRLDLYKQHIDRLVAAGSAYKCFKTPQELAAARDAARKEKRAYKYDRTESINLTEHRIEQYEAEGRPCVVRFRMPDRDITVHDEVLGDVTVKAEELEDFVILKSDGFPTFHLANIVDDALMGITHVLRGQEHLMNTPKHVALFEALFDGSSYALPRYAHIPLIFNADGSKMSKRDKAKVARESAKQWVKDHGGGDAGANELAVRSGLDASALGQFLNKKSDDTATVESLAARGALDLVLPEIDVHDFRRSGYLPQILLNYLALLGWSPGENIERFDMAFLVERFGLDRIGKSNARFDRAKLLAFNTEAIAQLSSDGFRSQLQEHDRRFPREGAADGYEALLGEARFRQFAECYRERSRTLEEPLINGEFFISDDFTSEDYDRKAVDKVLLKGEGKGLEVLRDLEALLTACEDWTAGELEKAIAGYAESKELGMGKVAQPLRVAVSGGTVSPPIFDTLEILGRGLSLSRVSACVRLFSAEAERVTQEK